MKRLAAVVAAAALALLVGAPAQAAVVDRVCIKAGSAAAAQITAHQVNGSSSIVRQGYCSSSTSDLSTFYVGGIPCRSPWGTLYGPNRSYSAAALNGDLVFTCS